MRWSKFLERKFLVAMGGVVTGVLIAFGRPEEASTVDKVLGSFISVGLSLGWIAAETSRDNSRDRVSFESPAAATIHAKKLPSKTARKSTLKQG
jgi:hypothetical protein